MCKLVRDTPLSARVRAPRSHTGRNPCSVTVRASDALTPVALRQWLSTIGEVQCSTPQGDSKREKKRKSPTPQGDSKRKSGRKIPAAPRFILRGYRFRYLPYIRKPAREYRFRYLPYIRPTRDCRPCQPRSPSRTTIDCKCTSPKDSHP